MTEQRHGGGTNLQQGVMSLGLRPRKDPITGSNQTVVGFTRVAPLQEGCDVKVFAWTRCIAWLNWCAILGKWKKGQEVGRKKALKKLLNIVEVMQCSMLVVVQSCYWDKISDYMTRTYRLDYRSVRSDTAQLAVYLEQKSIKQPI